MGTKENEFKLLTGNGSSMKERSYVFRAENIEERNRWVSKLNQHMTLKPPDKLIPDLETEKPSNEIKEKRRGIISQDSKAIHKKLRENRRRRTHRRLKTMPTLDHIKNIMLTEGEKNVSTANSTFQDVNTTSSRHSSKMLNTARKSSSTARIKNSFSKSLPHASDTSVKNLQISPWECSICGFSNEGTVNKCDCCGIKPQTLADGGTSFVVISHKWKTGIVIEKMPAEKDPDAFWKDIPRGGYSSAMFQSQNGGKEWVLYRKQGFGAHDKIMKAAENLSRGMLYEDLLKQRKEEKKKII